MPDLANDDDPQDTHRALISRLLLRLLLMTTLAISGVVSFRVPMRWAPESSRIEAPSQTECEYVSTVGDETPARGTETHELAIPVHASVGMFREEDERYLTWVSEWIGYSSRRETAQRARAPPVDG